MADYYGDGSDSYLASKGLVIMFQSMATGDKNTMPMEYHTDDPLAQERRFPNIAAFKAFVTSFSDSYSSDWNSTSVFGRNDPIYNFKATTRSISLVFDIVAASYEEATLNLARTQRLIKMLYPAYTSPTTIAANLTRPPLVKIKFANLIADHSAVGGSWFKTGEGQSPSVAIGGLLGVIKSLTVTPNFDPGVFDGPGKAELYPKLISVSLEFGVLHQSALGWDVSKESATFVGDNRSAWGGGGAVTAEFPYGAIAAGQQLEPYNGEDPAVDIYAQPPLEGGGGDIDGADRSQYDYAYEAVGLGPLYGIEDDGEAQTYADELYGEVELTGLGPGEPGYGVMTTSGFIDSDYEDVY